MLGRGWLRHTSKNATFLVLTNVLAIVCRYYKGTTGRNCSHNLCQALTCRLFCMLFLSLPPPRFSRIHLNCSFARMFVCVCALSRKPANLIYRRLSYVHAWIHFCTILVLYPHLPQHTNTIQQLQLQDDFIIINGNCVST